jgi:hypothetical protein
VIEATSDVLNSTATVLEGPPTSVDKMMGNYTDHFPTISETKHIEKKEVDRMTGKCIDCTPIYEIEQNDVADRTIGTCTVQNSISQMKKKDEKECVPPLKTIAMSVAPSSLNSPSKLLESPESCSEVIERLEGCDRSERHELVQWLKKHLKKLAVSKHGCRVAQKTLEVATGSDRDEVIAELADHVQELYESPHGNHVLSRAIEVLPAGKTTFVIEALQGKGLAVSKHRFGCRIICRLIEHAGEAQIKGLMAEILENIESLAKQAYGNFVVQSILEHSASYRHNAVARLLAIFPSLCMDRSGSLVAQRILDYCDDNTKQLAIECLNKENVIEVACSRYGCYVIEQLASMQASFPAALQSAHMLSEGVHELQRSEYAQRVISAFELMPDAVEPEVAKLEGGESSLE